MSDTPIENYQKFRPHKSRPSANTRSRAQATEKATGLQHVVLKKRIGPNDQNFSLEGYTNSELTVLQLLTGATTTLGVCILYRLQNICRNVKKVYCIVQAEDFPGNVVLSAKEFIYRSHRDKKLSLNDDFEAYFTEMGENKLGLREETYKTLLESITTIINAATVSAFYNAIAQGEDQENHQLRCMHNLIQLSLDVPTVAPAGLYHLTPSVVGYETAGDVRKNETYAAATARSLAIPARTLDRTEELLISAYKTDRAKTYTLWMPKFNKLPISSDSREESSAEGSAEMILKYVLDDRRWGEGGNRQICLENKANDTQ